MPVYIGTYFNYLLEALRGSKYTKSLLFRGLSRPPKVLSVNSLSCALCSSRRTTVGRPIHARRDDIGIDLQTRCRRSVQRPSAEHAPEQRTSAATSQLSKFSTPPPPSPIRPSSTQHLTSTLIPTSKRANSTSPSMPNTFRCQRRHTLYNCASSSRASRCHCRHTLYTCASSSRAGRCQRRHTVCTCT